MPFEKSVSPVVADLLKVRAYIAEHGFTQSLYDSRINPRCGCFIGTARILRLDSDLDGSALCLRFVEQELTARYGDASGFDDRAFDQEFLEANSIDTAVALDVIDAAIARAA